MKLITFILFLVASSSTLASFDSPKHNEQSVLRVLVWNVLHGANDVDNGPEEALGVIKEAKPHVVLLQESYDIDGQRPKLGAWLAGELGWNQYQGESTHLCVLTPYEFDTTFFHHEWHGVGAKLKNSNGREFIAWSIWIDWRSYITYELRSNPDISDEELLHFIDQKLKERLPFYEQALLAISQSSNDDPITDWIEKELSKIADF